MNTKNKGAIRSESSPLGFSTIVRGARVMALAGLSVLGLVAYGTASAQIVSPPPFPKDITVFPMRDFLGIAGFAPDADVLIQVRRGNSVVGIARGKTAPTDFLGEGGDLEVNHPGGICWQDVTPDITSNDVIQVTYDDTANNLQKSLPIGSGNSMRTANATVQSAVIVGETVVIKGKALQGITQYPLNRMEVRIIQPAFDDGPGGASRIGKRDIRGDSAGGRVDGENGNPIPGTSGLLTYDARTTACPVGCFTVVFTGLNATERQLAVKGGTRVLAWMATDAQANRLGMTIYEAGEVGGPGMGECPAGPGGLIGPNPPAYPVAYNPLNLVNAALPPADPSLLHEIVVFPSRDFVSPAGFPVGQEMQMVVRRHDPNNPNSPNGVIVGTARGTTVNVDGTGMMEVNHPGGLCWSGQTPDIRAGDKVDMFRIVNGAFAGGETQEVIGVTVSQAAFVNAVNQVVVNGTMPENWDLTRLEHRFIQPAFRDTAGSRIGRRDIRADTLGGNVGQDPIPGATGFLTQTSPTTWQAVYTGLNDVERALAIHASAESRIMAWLATGPIPPGDTEPTRSGLTIFEFNLAGGPGMGGCPATGSFTIPIPLP